MPAVRLSASEWIEKHRRGVAAVVDGKRHVVAREATSGEPALIEVDVEEPDARCAVVDGQLDARELARILMGFRGQPRRLRPSMGDVRTARDRDARLYVFDLGSGVTYLLD